MQITTQDSKLPAHAANDEAATPSWLEAAYVVAQRTLLIASVMFALGFLARSMLLAYAYIGQSGEPKFHFATDAAQLAFALGASVICGMVASRLTRHNLVDLVLALFIAVALVASGAFAAWQLHSAA